MLNKDTEKKLIKWQLGRDIDNLEYVGKYCPWGYPAVLVVKPFIKERNIISPNLFWLSCPYLVYKLDKLEDSGFIENLTFKLKNDFEFRNKIYKAHKRYAKMRKAKMTKEDLEAAKKISKDLFETLTKSGIGGIKDKNGIKCLHTHLADFLMDNDNAAADIIWEKVSWPKSCSICKERIDDIESSSY